MNSNITNNLERKPNILQRFFIICSGSDGVILNQCPSEWNKYTGIGATIFFTGLLAALSGGYALFSIFRTEPFAHLYGGVFGIIWGLLIFNLDRFIVSSIRKEGKLKSELLHAAPRFILAVLISFVIAKPIEVRLFESRIEQQILEDKRHKLKDEKELISELNDLSGLKKSIKTQNSELHTLDSLRKSDPSDIVFKNLLFERNIAMRQLNHVLSLNNPKISTCYRTIRKIKADSSNYIIQKDSLGNIVNKDIKPLAKTRINKLTQDRRKLSKEISDTETILANYNADIKNAREYHESFLTKQINKKQLELQSTVSSKLQADSIAQEQFAESMDVKKRSFSNNFITQLEAMGNLTRNNNTMRYTSFMIILLFIVIETAPIVVKILSKRGPYDDILRRIELNHNIQERELYMQSKSHFEAQKNIADEKSKLENDTELEIEKMRLNHELKNNKTILNTIAIKQSILADKRIEKWYQSEIEKINTSKLSLLVNNFWKLKDEINETEYFFRSNSTPFNELIIANTDGISKGEWWIGNNDKEITIIDNDLKTIYAINELTEHQLSLTNIESRKQYLFTKS